MSTLRFGRYVVCTGVALAMFAGCGGSNKQFNPSAGGVSAEQVHMRPAYSVVYSFKGGRDGAYPFAGLLAVKGTLYGATTGGGTDSNGTVFAITQSGKETVLHRFGGSGDGEIPTASLIDVKGTLYGTTGGGGTHGGGVGTVFAITKSGQETVLHSFGGSTDGEDGSAPQAGLIDVNGTLYGTTEDGGSKGCLSIGCGTVFAITTSGKETVLHSFAGGSGDGANPYANLIDVKGTLYGTTFAGGTNDDGTVFAITKSGMETVLHSFKGGSRDGANPYAGLVDVKGTLYGVTLDGGGKGCLSIGCGTVLAITTSGKETVFYSFAGGSGDGESPYASLIDVKGTLYGTTLEGGTNDDGTVFSITTSDHETVLHSFGGEPDGRWPLAGLINFKGTLYGTTEYGGTCAEGECGTVFALSP